MTLLAAHLIDGVSTDADALRRVIQTLSPGQVAAVLGTNDLKVTAGSGMQSVLAAGKGLVVGSQNVATQGSYGVGNDASVTQTHANSDATNPRNDLVGVKIEDAFYFGSNRDAAPVIVTGAPAPSPADPTPPSNWLPCARVRVNAGAGSIGTITDLRAFVFQTFLPGSNGMHFRDSANSRDNVQWDDTGLVTLRNGLLIPPTAGAALPATNYGTVPNLVDAQVLGVPASSIVIPVPSGGRNLHIRALLRSDQAGTGAQAAGMRFNGDSGNNYATQRFDAFSTTLTGAPTTGGSYIDQWFVPQAGVLANFFGWVEIDINDYASTTKLKTGRIQWTTWQAAAFSGSNMNSDYTSFMWNSTAAVTSVSLLTPTGNLIAGSESFAYVLP